MTEHTQSCTSPLSSMICFLAGGVAGASVALLLAPQSGRATREMTRRTLSDAARSARDLKDQLIRRGQRIQDEARHGAGDALTPLPGDGGAKGPA